MLDIRKRILIVISLIVAVILAILIYYFFVYKKAVVEELPSEESEITQEETTEEIIQKLTQTTTSAGEPTPFSEDVYAKQVGRLFVERFGTYSNQNNNVHIEDVMILVTDKMGRWLKTQSVKQSSNYIGVTTRVLASEVDEIDESSASVIIEAQKITDTAGTQEVENISGTVELLKVDGDWKVDGLFWD